MIMTIGHSYGVCVVFGECSFMRVPNTGRCDYRVANTNNYNCSLVSTIVVLYHADLKDI